MNTPSTRRNRPPARAAARGMSMIEVMVVIVLVSFGLLGVVGLQAKAVQASVSAEDSSRAALLANEMAAAMWGANTVSLPADTVSAWNTRCGTASAGGLPNGAGSVAVSAGVATITITWRAPHEPSDTSHSYVTQVQIAEPAP